ncbi:Phytochrome-like protein cph2 [Halomonas chromatireducens]|uniref:diguanylate cyclase n=2 Tax=Halomonas chromatireducens TaxID=507626 RepID=A0A0X8HGK9_9GAMM|nr:Phytochrome-like protein cph2 [Halomonas chromatireducens]
MERTYSVTSRQEGDGTPGSRSAAAAYWRDLMTSGGRTCEDCPHYLRITLLNLAGAASIIVWGVFLSLTLLGVLEASLWRMVFHVAGLLVSVSVIVGLRRGGSIAAVTHVAHAFLFISLLGLPILRADNPLAMSLPLIYPAMAFLLLGDIRKGVAGTLLMTAGLNIALALGAGPELRDSTMLLDGALTLTAGMSFQAVVLALYVHHRQQVLARLRAVGEQLSIQANRDSLTGLHNRRAFIEDLERELRRRDCDDRQLAFLILDIDGFKAYNDRYGHPQGDALLKRLASVMREVFSRQEDILLRLGGEEFGIIFRSEDEAQAEEMTTHLLSVIEELGEPAPDGPCDSVTVSAGLYLVEPGSGVDADHVYRRADEALYRAKAAGKACWHRASR